MTARKPPKPWDPRILHPEWTKRCRNCTEVKPISEFGLLRGAPMDLALDCHACVRPMMRAYHLRRAYGMTMQDYDRMFEAQGGRCAICRSDKSFGRGEAFNIDHDHSCSGHHAPSAGCPECVRGLVCNRCNVLIGWLEDHGEEVRSYLPKLFGDAFNSEALSA